MRRLAPYLFVVRYQRDSWLWKQQRMFLSEAAAYRLVENLRTPGRWQGRRLAPLVYLSLVRRPLGREEIIEEWEDQWA